MLADTRDRLREFRVTGPMAVCFCSLLLGVPFAVAWAADDGQGNQPFPRGLRQLVVVAAALHFGSVGVRVMKAVWKWEPIGPILGDLLAAYLLFAAAGGLAWGMHHYGVPALADLVSVLPAGWAFVLLGRAMTPSSPREPDGRPP